MFTFTTLPELFLESFGSHQHEGVLRYHSADETLSYSSSQVKTRVANLALGLLSLGLKRGECVGITGPSSPNWIMLDFAIQIAGGVSVPIFSKIALQNFVHELKDSSMRILFLGIEEEYEKAREHRGGLEHIITFGYPGAHPQLEDLLTAGRKKAEKHPDEFEKLIKLVKPSDLATIIYTSGSTGLPKGVELSQANIVSQLYASSENFRGRTGDVALSVLPLAHIFERMLVHYYIGSKIPVNFIDDPKNIGLYIKQIKPTLLILVPRILEKVYIKIKQGIAASYGLKKIIGSVAVRRAETRDETKPAKLFDKICDAMVYKKMRAGLGGRIRFVILGSAKLDENLARFFINAGLPLYEGYGMTETSPVITANCPGQRKIGTVGMPFPKVEIKIENGEILTKGPNVMQGYHNMPDETAETITPDGWLHTGDLGRIDEEGYLIITGRKKEQFKKSTGEYVAPVPIEQELMRIDGVDSAVVFAEGRHYVIALLFPDMEAAADIKKRISDAGADDKEFVQSREMYEYMKEHIAKVNAGLNSAQCIKKFHIMDHSASVEKGEITATLKMRRFTVEKMYKDIIEKLYT